jgi:hypothetical protein
MTRPGHGDGLPHTGVEMAGALIELFKHVLARPHHRGRGTGPPSRLAGAWGGSGTRQR